MSETEASDVEAEAAEAAAAAAAVAPGDKPESEVVGPSKPRLLSILGPGLISGASDDDPAAIGTYSQAGALYGYSLSWMALVCYPIMVAVQEVSGRIGRTTGQGLAGNLAHHAPGWLVHPCILFLVIANMIAIGADLSAMASVVQTLVGGPQLLYVALFGALCIGLQIFLSYARYVRILKWTTLSLFGYVAAVLLAGVDWGELARGFVPDFAWSPDVAQMVVAIFGVAISPYIFFWQSAQEAEDQRTMPFREPLVRAPEQAEIALYRIRVDTLVGMGVAIVIGLAIMTTTAATLNVDGPTEIATAAEAAEALRPVAGPFAFALFGLGIIGTGLLAVPVLAGSAAYALAEARRWPVGLARRPLEAKAFYATLTIAGLVGIAFNFTGIEPMQALFLSATINGVVAVPALALMLVMGGRRDVMGEFTIGGPIRLIGWLAVAIMGGCVVLMGVNLLGS
jgi:NRAMP (natural resistance-associated macrophage protein)-like metal ion transporter